MGLQAWWLGVRVERVEARLKRLRTRQKTLRSKADELAKQKKQGSAPADVEAREAKLEAERETVTRQIHEALAQEERLKDELKAARGETVAPTS